MWSLAKSSRVLQLVSVFLEHNNLLFLLLLDVGFDKKLF
jgi:hypothetical protein